MSDRPLFRERLEEPLTRVLDLRDRAVESFPVRVWRHFSRNNGFLLSAGMSYYVLFALFAMLYVTFAGAGVWLGGSTTAIVALVDLVNTYIPGLIGENGLFTEADVAAVARDSTSVLLGTGGIAIVVGLWTAIGGITFTRRAVRDIFGLPFDDRAYILLKLRDLLAAVVFGGALILGAVLATLGVWLLSLVFELIGWSTTSWLFGAGVRTLSVLIAFLIDAAALSALVRFLTGTSIPWRTIWPGATLGGAAMIALQLALGYLLAWVPTNPLLATFAVIVGLLLWCRWLSIVVLAAASWIAVSAEDNDHPLAPADERAARIAEREALVLGARVRVRRARAEAQAAPWYRRRRARRRVSDAERELAAADAELRREQAAQEASAPKRAWYRID